MIFLDGDWKNIEGRMNAWLADETWKLEAFRANDAGTGPDLYVVTYSQAFGCDPTLVTKKQRQWGKVIFLACFAPDTQVLTDCGYVAIKDVTVKHKLWDGVEWVTGQGAVYRGRRGLVDLDGVGVTPDHQIWAGDGWQEARMGASCPSTLHQWLAIGSGNLPSSAPTSKSRWFNVPAARNLTTYWQATCVAGQVRDAINALKKLRRTTAKITMAMRTLCLTRNCVGDYSTDFRPHARGAITPRIANFMPTEREASPSMKFGASTGGRSWFTFSRCQEFLTPASTWIASITTMVMSPATFSSSRTGRTWPKSPPTGTGECKSSKTASQTLSPVYDIAHAGPRNRFTIKTNSGHLIVHNCGYGGGVGAIIKMGPTYGMKPAMFVPPMMEALGPELWCKWLKKYPKALDKRGLPADQWAAIKALVLKGRAADPKITASWKLLQTAVTDAIDSPGKAIILDGYRNVTVERRKSMLFITLPSGRNLHYWNPRIREKRENVIVFVDGSVESEENFGNPVLLDYLVENGLAEITEKFPSRVIHFDGKVDRSSYLHPQWGRPLSERDLKAARATGCTAESLPQWAGMLGAKRVDGWGEKTLYGGLICENVVSGACLDILHLRMDELSRAGFPISLHTHDSAMAEVRRALLADWGLKELYVSVMGAPVPWAAGLPMGVSVHAGERYS